MQLNQAQIQQFKIDGYLVLPSVLDPRTLTELRAITQQHLKQRVAPFELETDVQYPGAPSSKQAEGGNTIRRLKLAYQRHEAFQRVAELAITNKSIQAILRCNQVRLNPNHHNCVMTKQARYSSKTLWHRDTRYWNFSDKYLINAWFALGDEQETNGAMKILPGSHRWEVSDEALDQAQFLKIQHPDNQQRLATQRLIELDPGDAVLFSAHCFHAAGKNTTNEPKFSLVFTYHGEGTTPIKGSPSEKLSSIVTR